MEIIIYLDSLFLLNMCMNFWVIRAVVYRLELKPKPTRMLLSAFFGTGIYILLILSPLRTRFMQLIEIGVSVPIMLLILLPPKRRNLFKQCLQYGFCYSFLVAGILRVVFDKWQLFAQRQIHIIAVLTGAFICFEGITKYVRTNKTRKEHKFCKVKLVSERKTVNLRAIVDTGNSLLEPISKKPVCLVEESILEGIIPEGDLFIRAIPYRSVGCDKGLLYGFEIPELHITYGTEQFFLQKVICAGTKHKLSTNDMYQMILHPAHIAEEYKISERGEGNVVSKRSKKKNLFAGRTGVE